MTRGVLVAGIGNIFQGDDGFGPEAVRRLASARPDDARVRVVDYGIRGMHLAYDLLEGYDALVIVDAVPPASLGSAARPGSLGVLVIGPEDLGEGDVDPHGMNPVAVLASLGALGGTLPPTFVVGCCPSSLEDHLGLTETVAGAVDEAVALTSRLVDDLLAGRLTEGGDVACASGSPVR